MKFCDVKVMHKAFGAGKILKFEENRFIVLFDKSQEEKKFEYPTAFGKYITTENEEFLHKIEEDKKRLEQEIEEKRIEKIERIINESKEAPKKRRSNKIPKEQPKSNIAFKCNYCDGGKGEKTVGFKGVCSDGVIEYNIKEAKHIWCKAKDTPCNKYLEKEISRGDLEALVNEEDFVCYESQMLSSWRAFAGIVQTGKRKGEPMRLKNVEFNSLAMLTTRMPHVDDSERFIFAVFLVNENYEGDQKDEGHVGAHDKYRIELTPDEAKELKFWDYYYNENNPEMIKFGSGLHRYFTDMQSAQVLKKICQIKKGTEEEDLAIEFFEHYCEVKKLDANNISSPEGALIRNKEE